MPFIWAPTVADADLRQMSSPPLKSNFSKVITIREMQSLGNHPLQHYPKHIPQMLVPQDSNNAQL